MSIDAVVDHVPQWYVVHTNPKQEDRAYSNLRSWGVETMHPKMKARRVNEFTGALSYVTKPLFPRYIFAKFNASKQLAKISFRINSLTQIKRYNADSRVHSHSTRIFSHYRILSKVGKGVLGEATSKRAGSLRGVVREFELRG